MLKTNIPGHVTDRAARTLDERTPNFCPDCGAEIVLAGGADERVTGLYDHIDPLVLCSECGQRFRHGAAFEQAEGHEQFDLGLDWDEGDTYFGDYTAWCNLHTERMKPTKSYHVDGVPARQYKCPECDLVATVLFTGG